MRFVQAMNTAADAVQAGLLPCAVAAVFQNRFEGADIAAFGRLWNAEAAPAADTDTRFDLASLTKVVGTTPLLLRLVQRGLVDLDQPVTRWFPAYAAHGKDGTTLLDLTLHRSGLPPLYDFAGARCPSTQQAAEIICGLPLENPLGSRVVYSDLGFILLGAVLERAGGDTLDALVRREVLHPLGMAHTGYRPAGGNIACTELDPATGKLLCGAVHDENARSFGGVSGHAGLFGTAGDLCRFGQMLLDGKTPEGAPYLDGHLLALTRRNLTAGLPGQGRAVGWMVNQPPPGPENFRENPAGEGWGDGSFGHTGFTGTSLWAEPARALVCVLLTNRVCPTRENAAIFPLRRAFHTAALEQSNKT